MNFIIALVFTFIIKLRFLKEVSTATIHVIYWDIDIKTIDGSRGVGE